MIILLSNEKKRTEEGLSKKNGRAFIYWLYKANDCRPKGGKKRQPKEKERVFKELICSIMIFQEAQKRKEKRRRVG